MKNKRNIYRDLNKKEKKFAKELLTADPLMTDALVAEAMHTAGFADDLSKKVLRNKIRYYRKKVVPADKEGVKVNKREITVGKTESGEPRKEEVATMYARNPDTKKFKSEEDYTREAGLDPNIFKVSGMRMTTTETETDLGSAASTISTVTFSRRNPKKDIDVQSWFIRSTKAALLNRLNGNEDAMQKMVDAFGSNEAALAVINGIMPMQTQTNIGSTNIGDVSFIVPCADMHFNGPIAVDMAKSYKKTFLNHIFPAMATYLRAGVNVRTIDFALMGDIVQCDNKAGMTAAGTQVASMDDIYGAMDVAANFIEWMAKTALHMFGIPVRIIYVYGNHDTTTGFGVVRTAQAALRGIEGITFMTNQNLFPFDREFDESIGASIPWYRRSDRNPEYMWVKYGNMGVTFCHGKFGKRNSVNIPAMANPNYANEVKRNAVIYGHLHHRDIQNTAANQDNFGIGTPNPCDDPHARSCGYLTEPEFSVIMVDHTVNRINCVATIPSLPWDVEMATII